MSSKAILLSLLCVLGLAAACFYAYGGMYGVNVLIRRGGSLWISVEPNDPRLSSSMRLALNQQALTATVGHFEWRQIEDGLEISEVPVNVAGSEVDRLLLARLDPRSYRFVVRTAPAGNMDLHDWVGELDAAAVINGSYYSRRGQPDMPLLSARVQMGPHNYKATHGAFVASSTFVGIRDLAGEDWRVTFQGADDAMVSYPLLLAADGSSRVKADPRWLANRSFVGHDRDRRIIFGTTVDAFFSLDRLARFLREAPLDLAMALNLDGGPLACQAILRKDFHREFCGKWELAASDGKLKLLTSVYGERRWALPVILAAVRK